MKKNRSTSSFTPDQPFRRNSRIGIQYELMRQPNGATVKEIMEITNCGASRVRSAVSEIRSRIGHAAVITHSNLKDTIQTRYEIKRDSDNTVYNAQSAQNSSADSKSPIDTITAVEEIIPALKILNGKKFFEVSYQGSRAIVSLQKRNLNFEDKINHKDKIDYLAKVLVAFDLSAKLVMEDEPRAVLHAFERLEIEFSRQLRNLENSDKDIEK